MTAETRMVPWRGVGLEGFASGPELLGLALSITRILLSIPDPKASRTRAKVGKGEADLFWGKSLIASVHGPASLAYPLQTPIDRFTTIVAEDKINPNAPAPNSRFWNKQYEWRYALQAFQQEFPACTARQIEVALQKAIDSTAPGASHQEIEISVRSDLVFQGLNLSATSRG